MPCKIDIEERLTSDVKISSDPFMGARLDIAQKEARSINKSYGYDVVSFYEGENDYMLSRRISIPEELIEKYYQNELRIEQIEDESRRREGNWDIDNEGNIIPKPQYQLSETPSSKASPETISKIKELAKKTGIVIEKLSDYAKQTGLPTTGINAVADLIRKVVAVAEGMDNVALTEEIVHMATAILEQTNPKLITELISKIDRFKIYNATLKTYKERKEYQLSDGKPDIRKIKKEAVDKLIAEVIVNLSEGNTEFPELMQEETRSRIKQWWETIKDFIRGIYRKSNIEIFEKAATSILTEDIGSVEDIKSEGIYLQTVNSAVDKIWNNFINESNKLQLHDATPNKKRHYTYDGIEVAQTVTEKVKKGKEDKRSDLQKKLDEMKRDWGLDGHRFLEQVMHSLIDNNGYKRDKRLSTNIETNLDKTIQEHLTNFAIELVNSYKEGTRFLIEVKVVNKKVKGMIASTIDFMAIEPNGDNAKVDVLDWKFMSIDKTQNEDIQWYKKEEWVEQMGEYNKMLYNYDVEYNQSRKKRMIPFVLNYDLKIKNDVNSGIFPKSIEIGKLDNTKETNLYLLPVPLNSESTGNDTIDQLLSSLRKLYEKVYKTHVSEEDKFDKNTQLNQLNKAIRHLHLKLDFEPLVNVGETFLKNARKSLNEFKGLDYTKLSAEEIKAKLHTLREYLESSDKFTSLDKVYLSHISREDMTKEDKLILGKLERIAAATDRMIDEIEQIQAQYVVHLAGQHGFSNVLQAEAPVKGMVKTFLEASKLPAKLINLVANLSMNASNLVAIKVAKKLDEFEKLVLALNKDAEAVGKSPFDMIATISKSGLKLIKKIDPEFWKKINEAKVKGDKQFLLNSIDINLYNELKDEYIKRGIESLNNTQFSTDEEVDDYKRNKRIIDLKNSVDINSATFNGYQGYAFAYLFNQALKEEEFLSKEYKEMSKSKAALDVWNFFTDLNKQAKKLGYINKQGSSFFPLIEATMLEKLSQTSDIGGQLKDFFKDLTHVKPDEENFYSKIDDETGELEKRIPKYFTRTDKEAEQLSRDLMKVGSLWVNALYTYENAINLEDTIQTIISVERSKGSLIIDKGEIVWEQGVPKVNKDVNPNADILQTIADDYLYNLGEDLDSIGNIGMSAVAQKLGKNADKVMSAKKAIKNADVLTRIFAVGLKPLIAMANYFGVNIHAYINGGKVYIYSEFLKNNFKVTIGNLSTEEKALLHLINPLNEDIAEVKHRKMARKESLLDYLKTWTFTEVMMVTNSFPERRLQYANALSFNQNSMVVDGKIVNIRQYLKKQDEKKYKDSYESRRALEKTFEERVKELQESSSLSKIVKVEDDTVIIPGVSDEEIARYRTKVIEFNRKLNGQLNRNNKAGYRRDTILTSFMMFKTWIPGLLSQRVLDIKYNPEIEEWEYGRVRLFVKTWAHLGFKNVYKIRQILLGTDEGIKIMQEMLEAKRIEYYNKTGQQLEITEEEFYDLVRRELSNEMKELGVLLGVMGVVLSAKAAEPPEDATDYEKNQYKLYARAINKMMDEISFYYDPRSFENITKGSIMPSLGLMAKVGSLIENIRRESVGYILDDEEMIKAGHPVKYFLNLVPGAAQFQNEVLPYINPELAKELGVRVTTQSRRQ